LRVFSQGSEIPTFRAQQNVLEFAIDVGEEYTFRLWCSIRLFFLRNVAIALTAIRNTIGYLFDRGNFYEYMAIQQG
jgi:hypothetical protein